MTNNPTAKQPRRFRKVETIRDKTEKVAAQETAERPRAVFWRGFTWPLRMLGRSLRAIGHVWPLRPIGRWLRWFFRLRAIRFVGIVLGLRYLRNSWRELRQVTWPSRRESRQLTTAVVLFATVFGLLIAVVDYGLDKVFKQVLLK